MNINEAIFMEDEEREEILTIISKFQKATNRALKVELTRFYCKGYDKKYLGRQVGFDINGIEFNKHPCTETWEDYVNRIKSYLFDLLMEE